MSLTADQFFALLPAVYRTRDAANGGPLQALFAVLAAQSGIVEDNIKQLYDDQFIETCAPWVIPYLGDLIGYNSIFEIASATYDSRAEVANTIGYRRRKGTLLALEQLSMDVSGRPALAVEEFKRLITTESMRHVRPRHATTLSIRRAVEHHNTAFDTTNRTIDVRRIVPRLRLVGSPDATPLDIALHGPGRFNLPDIAIHLWRLRAWPVGNAPALPLGEGRYMFSPLGQNIPLFSQPPVRSSFSRLTQRIDVPQPISRHEFARSLDPDDATTGAFYGSNASILLIADGVPIAGNRICCANLDDRDVNAWCKVEPGKIAIDPELGRIEFAFDVPLPQSLRVSYSYGFAAEMGGGPYDRSTALSTVIPATAGFFAIVGSAQFPTLESAVEAWNRMSPGAIGIIVLPGFERFTCSLTGLSAIQLPSQSRLTVAAGSPLPASGPTDIAWTNACVTLTGDIEVTGAAPILFPTGEIAPAGQLMLSGVWLEGQLIVTGEFASVQIADSTLVPGLRLTRDGRPEHEGEPSIVVNAVEASLSISRSIVGPIAASAGGSTRICSSIVDATAPCCVAYSAQDLASAGADLHIEDSTVIGRMHARTMPLASNTIFYARRPRRDSWPAPIWVSRRQTGCVRFCSLPFNSITPRRYECLPPDAASEAALHPQFITLRYGSPDYALFSGYVPLALWQGADNGSQIGVYHQIQETEAIRNVQLRAPEYLPIGLESGVFLHPSHAVIERFYTSPLSQGYQYAIPRKRRSCDGEEIEQEQFAGIGGLLI